MKFLVATIVMTVLMMAMPASVFAHPEKPLANVQIRNGILKYNFDQEKLKVFYEIVKKDSDITIAELERGIITQAESKIKTVFPNATALNPLAKKIIEIKCTWKPLNCEIIIYL